MDQSTQQGESAMGEPEKFINPYAEASQARTVARQPVHIDHSPSVETNAVARVEANHEATPSRPVAAIKPHQKAERVIEPADTSPLSANACEEQTGSTAMPRVLKVDEVADYLRVSVRQIWRQLESEPEFPRPFRIGGAIRWDRLVIERYVVRLQARSLSGR